MSALLESSEFIGDHLVDELCIFQIGNHGGIHKTIGKILYSFQKLSNSDKFLEIVSFMNSFYFTSKNCPKIFSTHISDIELFYEFLQHMFSILEHPLTLDEFLRAMHNIYCEYVNRFKSELIKIIFLNCVFGCCDFVSNKKFNTKFDDAAFPLSYPDSSRLKKLHEEICQLIDD